MFSLTVFVMGISSMASLWAKLMVENEYYGSGIVHGKTKPQFTKVKMFLA